MKHKNGTNLEVKTAELIPSYKFDAICIETDNYEKTPERIWSDCCRKQGGFNPYTRQFTPLKYASEGLAVCDALDAITAAVEAGIVDRNDWSNQLFASETDFEAFLEELEYYDETNRLTDRWWWALATIINTRSEEGFVTSSEMATALRNSVEEGEERKRVLRLEAEYKSRPDSAPAKLNKRQKEAVAKLVLATRRRAWDLRATEDVTCQFRFENLFYELRGKTLYAREARLDDLNQANTARKTTSGKRARP